MIQFDVPVVLFTFKRIETTLRILDRIRQVAPKKLYILSDQGRNKDEITKVSTCRQAVEKAIDWSCEVVKNYAEDNRGVHANIGLGAKWVFEREENAIFLEDDNLPEVSFFYYCKELLEKYREDERILWICGTNYLTKYTPPNGDSYVFTRHLLPCGWASWRKKFVKYYDADLQLADNKYTMEEIRHTYLDQRLYKQQLKSILLEKERRDSGVRYGSWDYHMALSIRANSLFGISPSYNLIKNIGVDDDSEHGGTSFNNIMTERFCGIGSDRLSFPLIHPASVIEDSVYNKRVSRIILLPLRYRLKAIIISFIKRLLGISSDSSLSGKLKLRRGKRGNV